MTVHAAQDTENKAEVHAAQDAENRAEALWRRWLFLPIVGPALWRRYLAARAARYAAAERAASS